MKELTKKEIDFIESYYHGFHALFDMTEKELFDYYEESIYGGYPEEPAGSVWESEGKSIYCLIRLLKPQRILEIGNFLGRSSNHILQAVEKNGFGKVTLIDIEERLEFKRLHSQKFTRVLNDSLNVLSQPFNFDLIIQDGDHTYQHVKKELELILQNNMQNKYYIWAHDYWQRSKPEQCGVWRAWDEMRNKFDQFQSFRDSVTDCGCSIAKKI